MIDTQSLKDHIRFAIRHHGTKTQGEEYRQEQVAEYLTETFLRLQQADSALTEALKDFHGPGPVIKLSVC